ncbi:MAG TPA: glycosyltransferase [Candidatus Acidoferrales bacterium]|nr:glycosyltransferase [Candidatus Acidoferrales bacterium]
MPPRVSVLVNTYNHERFIAQAIQSVLDQDFPPDQMEILVVDDGSTDGTPQALQPFLPRIRYIRKKNGGQASAFNAAIPELHGEFVAFLDADDWWAKNKLSAVLAVFQNDPSIGTVGHAYYCCHEQDRPGNNLTEIVSPDASTRITLSNREGARRADPLRVFFGTSRLAVRKTILDRLPPIPDDLVFSADAFVFTVAMALADAYVLREPLCFYRLHTENLHAFRSKDVAKQQRRYMILRKLLEVLPVALAAVGTSPGITSALLRADQLEAEQLKLRYNGGWPWETFRTELRGFRQAYRSYSVSYALYKWVLLVSTLLMPPRAFYRLRDWYAEHNLRRFRRVLGEPVPTASIQPRRANELEN